MTVLHLVCIRLHLAASFVIQMRTWQMTGLHPDAGHGRAALRSQMDGNIIRSAQGRSPFHIVCARGRFSRSNRRFTVVKGDQVLYIKNVPNFLQALLNVNITS
jgi:hypothetical protein